MADFSLHLIDNLLTLHRDIVSGVYDHGGYVHFRVSDPKPRDIHKASVRDRIVHHAVYRVLYPYFDRQFIYDSYSCRVKKGTHRALRRFEQFVRQEGRNGTRTAWVLKGDITKCFASVDHLILLDILRKHIQDERLFGIIKRILESFSLSSDGVGIPLGNLTSQLFINIYLNELDQFVKRQLKIHRYIRYADDFVLFSYEKDRIMECLPRVATFLQERLALELHPKKIVLKTVASGVDFLGWVHFPDHRVLRTVTKRRMCFRLGKINSPAARASYSGLLQHGNAKILENNILAKEN